MQGFVASNDGNISVRLGPDRLLGTLERLRDLGNTVVVVEHDEDTMRASDYLIDFGPGPGVRGGEDILPAGVRSYSA